MSKKRTATPSLPPLGAHMSIAGGYYKAAEAAGDSGMSTVQILTNS